MCASSLHFASFRLSVPWIDESIEGPPPGTVDFRQVDYLQSNAHLNRFNTS